MNNQGNKQWVWLALDIDTREIVGVYIGDRDDSSAKKLWDSLPPVYRQCAVAYTDYWAAYGAVFPRQRHQAVGKAKQRGLGGLPHERLFQEETGKTS